ncbi:MAG: hypothetical protein ACRDJG_00655, partial [Actinomycetota bacterium]
LRGLRMLRSLDLWGTEVGDGGLVHLKHLPNLSELDLGETRIGDGALDHLSEMSSLRRLQLGESNLSEAALERLRRALPNCLITGGQGPDDKTSVSDYQDPPTAHAL